MSRRAACDARGGAFLLLALLASYLTPGALADIFRLKTGGTVSGQLVDIDAGTYCIRTTVGVVRVPSSAVESVETADTPFEEYDRRAAQAADSAEDQTALATWCEEQGLKAERRKHLLRALALNPDYGPARRALGYVRVGELWVDGRRVVERGAEPEKAGEAEMMRLARAIQVQWRQRIEAIKHSLLDSGIDRMIDEGRAKIREIRDPLAILPLTQVLSEGDLATRALLIELLSRFPEDEATLNLGLLGLVDEDRDLRVQAVAALIPRHDSRIVEQYRTALRKGNDLIVARAAAGLGQMNAAEAVPDLIELLTALRTKWVETGAGPYLLFWPQVFTGRTVVSVSSGTMAVHLPEVGVARLYAGDWYNTDPLWEVREVTMYRTDVLQALRRITGQDFGFEREEWRRWYEGRKR